MKYTSLSRHTAATFPNDIVLMLFDTLLLDNWWKSRKPRNYEGFFYYYPLPSSQTVFLSALFPTRRFIFLLRASSPIFIIAIWLHLKLHTRDRDVPRNVQKRLPLIREDGTSRYWNIDLFSVTVLLILSRAPVSQKFCNLRVL